MIRVALLEYEKETKDIVFILSKMFMQVDWTFRHYTKASDLLRAMKEEEYSVFIFDEIFKTPRMESVFVHDNPNAVFIYVCTNPIVIRQDDQRGRIFYIEKDKLSTRLNELQDVITSQSKQKELYTLSYDGVKVNLPYEEIYYLEKNEKMVYFYTKKGVFHQRINMSDLEIKFEPYGFIRTHVSYLVNEKHVVAWYKDEVDIVTGERIPLSRAQKRKILAKRANFS